MLQNYTLYRFPTEEERAKGKQVATFTVSRSWLDSHVQETFHTSLLMFLAFYTWDESTQIYKEAVRQGILREPEKPAKGVQA